MLPLEAEQLLKLRYHSPDSKVMTTNINQFGSGDNVAGDKIVQSGGNFGIGIMKGGTIEDGAIISGQYNKGSNDLQEVLQLIASMKEAIRFFPQDKQKDINIEIEDLEVEIRKPEEQHRLSRIKKYLTAVATAGTLAIAGLSATNEATVQLNEFVDNASTLANKFQLELPVADPTPPQTLPPAP